MTNDIETTYTGPEPKCSACFDTGFVVTGIKWDFDGEGAQDVYESCDCGCRPDEPEIRRIVLTDEPIRF